MQSYQAKYIIGDSVEMTFQQKNEFSSGISASYWSSAAFWGLFLFLNSQNMKLL